MQNALNTAMLGGKNFDVTGYVRLKGENEVIPVVDVPQISDYEYQLMNLKNRIEHPEHYESENVSEVMKRLKTWLLERTTETLRLQFQQKYRCCFDFMMRRR